MKNDLDFIREKIEKDGVSAPEDMNESFVLEKISASEQNKAKPRRRRLKVAASLAVVTAAAITAAAIVPQLNTAQPEKPKTVLAKAVPAGVRQFGSYAELKKELKKLGNGGRGTVMYKSSGSELVDYGAAASEDSVQTGGSSGGGHAETYIQVEGVDEADIVKTDGKYIYVVADESVKIFTAEGKASKEAAKLTPFSEWIDPELFVSNGKLTVVGTEYLREKKATPDEADFDYEGYYFGNRDAQTRAVTYDISDIGNIKKTGEFSQSGSYVSARMTGGRLYLVTENTPYTDDYIPYVCCGDEKTSLPADSIYCPQKPQGKTFVNVSSYEPDTGKSDTKSILGVAENIYCSANNLYVYSYNGWYGSYRGAADVNGDDTTQLIKLSLGDKIGIKASSKVKGRTYDRYAFDEKDGNLRVATTSLGKNDKDENNLFVLDESLRQLGSVTGFAKNESIKAVKYVGDTAYVITYEQTDPLFVIDLGDSSKPVILGEAKISGFSSVLVPVDDNTMLGIGYSTNDDDIEEIGMEVTDGLKLALFDVSDKADPKVLDSKVFRDCYSEAQLDPRAVVINPERGLYTVDYNSYTDDDEVGAMTFSVKDGKISVTDRYAAEKLDSVDRCTYVGDNIYLLNIYDGKIESREYV